MEGDLIGVFALLVGLELILGVDNVLVIAILVSRCQPVALFLFSRFLFRSRRYSLGLGVLQLGVLAGSRAPLSVQAVVCFTLPNFSRIDSSSLVDLSASRGWP